MLSAAEIDHSVLHLKCGIWFCFTMCETVDSNTVVIVAVFSCSFL